MGDAHQKLLQKYPDLGLVLVGRINAATQRNKDYFESKKYKNIHFTGFIPDAERDWIFTRSLLYLNFLQMLIKCMMLYLIKLEQLDCLQISLI